MPMQLDTICGANAVAAIFKRRPDDVLRLYYTSEQRMMAGPICSELAKRKRAYRMLESDEMARAAGTMHHGGIAAVATQKPLPAFDLANPPRHQLLLILDGVGNPHNLGAIARCAGFFGVGAMVLHAVPGAALPSDAAYRTAEGALEYLDVFRTADLVEMLVKLKPLYRTVATSLRDEAVGLADLPRDRPIALVLGHEERGVSAPVLAACRREVRILGGGEVQSLNVAQAAAVILAGLR